MISEKDIYEFAKKRGMIDIAHIQCEIMEDERKKYLDMHPYSIWERNGYFYTYLVDERSKKRRQVKRKNKSDLEDVIIEHVKVLTRVKISDVFEEYIQRKEQSGSVRPSTIRRYRVVFNRHYVATEWDQTDVGKLTMEDISDFIEDEIGRCDLNAKGLANLKTITTGILKRARKNHLIDFSYRDAYEMVDVAPRKTYRDNDREIITPSELRAFIRYVSEHRTTVNLALLLMAITGLRVGEMATLKFSDFITDTSFKVLRTETFYKKGDHWVYDVADTPKTLSGVRTVYIPRTFSWVVRELKRKHPFAEFVCTNDKGERIRTYTLRNYLRGICKKLPEFSQSKSPHKLRKTFCSIMLDQGFDHNLVTSVMGHTDILTSERYYHFDRKDADQKQRMFDGLSHIFAV